MGCSPPPSLPRSLTHAFICSLSASPRLFWPLPQEKAPTDRAPALPETKEGAPNLEKGPKISPRTRHSPEPEVAPSDDASNVDEGPHSSDGADGTPSPVLVPRPDAVIRTDSDSDMDSDMDSPQPSPRPPVPPGAAAAPGDTALPFAIPKHPATLAATTAPPAKTAADVAAMPQAARNLVSSTLDFMLRWANLSCDAYPTLPAAVRAAFENTWSRFWVLGSAIVTVTVAAHRTEALLTYRMITGTVAWTVGLMNRSLLHGVWMPSHRPHSCQISHDLSDAVFEGKPRALALDSAKSGPGPSSRTGSGGPQAPAAASPPRSEPEQASPLHPPAVGTVAEPLDMYGPRLASVQGSSPTFSQSSSAWLDPDLPLMGPPDLDAAPVPPTDSSVPRAVSECSVPVSEDARGAAEAAPGAPVLPIDVSPAMPPAAAELASAEPASAPPQDPPAAHSPATIGTEALLERMLTAGATSTGSLVTAPSDPGRSTTSLATCLSHAGPVNDAAGAALEPLLPLSPLVVNAPYCVPSTVPPPSAPAAEAAPDPVPASDPALAPATPAPTPATPAPAPAKPAVAAAPVAFGETASGGAGEDPSPAGSAAAAPPGGPEGTATAPAPAEEVGAAAASSLAKAAPSGPMQPNCTLLTADGPSSNSDPWPTVHPDFLMQFVSNLPALGADRLGALTPIPLDSSGNSKSFMTSLQLLDTTPYTEANKVGVLFITSPLPLPLFCGLQPPFAPLAKDTLAGPHGRVLGGRWRGGGGVAHEGGGHRKQIDSLPTLLAAVCVVVHVIFMAVILSKGTKSGKCCTPE